MTIANGLIVVTTTDAVMPTKFQELAYGKFPSYFGSAAYLQEADGQPELVLSGSSELPSPKEFMEQLDSDKDLVSVLYFANSKTPLTTESEQPFTILKKGNDALLVAFMEGDFVSKKGADDLHTDEYHVSKMITSYVEKIYTKMCAGDITKLDKELQEDDVKEWMENLCGNRGVIVLYSVTGTVFKFETGNDLGETFPWGYVSNKLGFVEKSSKEAIPAAEPAAEKRGRFGLKKATVPQIASTEAISTTIAEANKTETGVKVPLMAKPPQGLIGNKNKLKAWYEEWCTEVPTNYKNGVEAPANDKYIVENTRKFGKLQDQLEKVKDRLTGSSTNPAEYRAFTPIITPERRSILTALLESGEIKALINKSQVLDPEALKSGKDVTPASAQLGIKFEDTFRWDFEVMHKFIEKSLGATFPQEKTMPIILAWREALDEVIKMLMEDGTGKVTVKGEAKVEPEAVAAPAATGRGNSRFAKKAA